MDCMSNGMRPNDLWSLNTVLWRL